VRVWLEKRTRAGRANRRSILRIVREGPQRREATSEKGKPLRPLDVVLDKLERLLDTEPTTAWSAQDLAIVSVERALRDVRRAAQADVYDVPGMHTLRIREKRLRYTSELFANELGEDGRRLVTHATRLQRRLGELHDFDEALATVTRARGLAKVTQRRIIATLQVARATCAAKVEPHLIEARGLAAPLALSHSDSPPNAAT
jgi:CHAD domain-containing protein